MEPATPGCSGNHPDSHECSARLLPIRDALDVLSGKWKIPIIVALSFDHVRFRELHRKVEGITPRMLSKELKELEMNGLVKRTVYSTIPTTVEYQLTDHGRTLFPVVDAMYIWGQQHRSFILQKPAATNVSP